jgi:hypothetical protein
MDTNPERIEAAPDSRMTLLLEHQIIMATVVEADQQDDEYTVRVKVDRVIERRNP